MKSSQALTVNVFRQMIESLANCVFQTMKITQVYNLKSKLFPWLIAGTHSIVCKTFLVVLEKLKFDEEFFVDHSKNCLARDLKNRNFGMNQDWPLSEEPS